MMKYYLWEQSLAMNRSFLRSLGIALALVCLFGINSGYAQTEDSSQEYVLVRIYEPVGHAGEIVITYGGTKSERLAIEQLNSDHNEINGNKIVDVFNRLNSEGYRMITSGSAGSGNPASLVQVSSYVFSRARKP